MGRSELQLLDPGAFSLFCRLWTEEAAVEAMAEMEQERMEMGGVEEVDTDACSHSSEGGEGESTCSESGSRGSSGEEEY